MRQWQRNFMNNLPRIFSLTQPKLCLQNRIELENLTNHSHGSMQVKFRTNFEEGKTTVVIGDSELVDHFDPYSTIFIATTNIILPAGLDATVFLGPICRTGQKLTLTLQ